jgi:DNA excision repair protein ERCC-4
MLQDPFALSLDERPEPVEVLIDDRERADEVVAHLRADPALSIIIRRLDLGDYRINNRVLVERKTVSDFALSLIDGRLFNQAARLAQSPCRPLLLVEGPIGAEEEVPVKRCTLQGAWVTLTLIFNIPCLRTFSSEETANAIRFAGLQLNRHFRSSVHRPGYRPKRRRKRQLFILQGLPGIGSKRAEQLLRTFGSVEAVMTADLDSLAKVDGIGKGTAQAIRDLISPEQNDPDTLID